MDALQIKRDKCFGLTILCRKGAKHTKFNIYCEMSLKLKTKPWHIHQGQPSLLCVYNVKNIFSNPTHQLHHKPWTHSSFPFTTFFIEENDECFSFTTHILFLRSFSETWNVAFTLRRMKKMACGVHGCVSWNSSNLNLLCCFTCEETCEHLFGS